MKTIQSTDLQDLLLRSPALALIDVRTPAEFAEVHALNARNVPLDRFDPKALAAAGSIAKSSRPIFFAAPVRRATTAAEKMAKEGFDNAVVVQGGTLAWIEAGLPVNRGEAKTISLERQVRIGAGSLVLLGVVLAWQVHPVVYRTFGICRNRAYLRGRYRLVRNGLALG